MLKDLLFDLQLFAEENDPGQNDPTENELQDEPKTFDETYVKKLRDEAAANRVKAKRLEQQLEAMPGEITAKVLNALGLEPDPDKNFDKQLKDAQKKAQDAEKRANDRLIRAEVKALSVEMGLVDADAALALMDKANVKVADGTVEGVKEALEALIEVKPWLKKGQEQKVGGGTNPPGAGDGQVNPWKAETFNLTMQGKILRENPALAEKLRAAAGK